MKEIDIRELNVDVTSCSGVNYIDEDIAVIDDLNGLSVNNEFLSPVDR